MACSLAGSLVPQGRPTEWYVENYQTVGTLIVTLQIDTLFSSWYFILLVVLLSVSIVLCCLRRFNVLRKMRESLLEIDYDVQHMSVIGAKAAEDLCSYLSDKRYKRYETENTTVFCKNQIGHYGSVIVHLSILMILVFGGLVLSLSDVSDHNVMPGENLILKDGTVLSVESFRITDHTGRTDYVSALHVTAPDGASSGLREISVNNPLTFRSKKYYQFTFGTVGTLTAVNTVTGGSDLFYLTERSFFTADGRNGVWFEILFPGYVTDEEGRFFPVWYRGGLYPDPIYQVLVADNGNMESQMVLPGEAIQIGDIAYEFNKPVNFPGIRVKVIPNPFQMLLYASFVLIHLGFWICFYHIPVKVVVQNDRYFIRTSNEAQLIGIETFLKQYGHDEHDAGDKNNINDEKETDTQC